MGIDPPPDSDQDGVLDADDNCPDDPNADQVDWNMDGAGDAWPTPYGLFIRQWPEGGEVSVLVDCYHGVCDTWHVASVWLAGRVGGACQTSAQTSARRLQGTSPQLDGAPMEASAAVAWRWPGSALRWW